MSSRDKPKQIPVTPVKREVYIRSLGGDINNYGPAVGVHYIGEISEFGHGGDGNTLVLDILRRNAPEGSVAITDYNPTIVSGDIGERGDKLVAILTGAALVPK